MLTTHTDALGIVREQRRHRALNALAAGCLVLAVVRLALTSVPEPLPWLSEAGELIYDLALAFLAGWIFHLLVVVVPEAHRKARLDSIVAGRIDFLIRAGFTLAKPLARAANVDPDVFPLPPEAMERACARIRPSDPPRGWAGDWHGLIRHLERITDVQRLAIKPFYARLGEESVSGPGSGLTRALLRALGRGRIEATGRRRARIHPPSKGQRFVVRVRIRRPECPHRVGLKVARSCRRASCLSSGAPRT